MLTMTARPGLSVLVFTALAVGCVENVTEPVDEPPAIDDELLEFYTAFCTHWEGCDIDFSARVLSTTAGNDTQREQAGMIRGDKTDIAEASG